jgi:hypothetical protein
VQYSDGSRVEYQSIADLKAARSDIALAVSATSARPAVRRIKIYTNKDF